MNNNRVISPSTDCIHTLNNEPTLVEKYQNILIESEPDVLTDVGADSR